jgi:hypothetical protein
MKSLRAEVDALKDQGAQLGAVLAKSAEITRAKRNLVHKSGITLAAMPVVAQEHELLREQELLQAEMRALLETKARVEKELQSKEQQIIGLRK